mgnify:CR=1 FL=1
MAYQALYRKYRPTNFDEVVGQTHIIQTLKNAIVQNRIAHAYLFCGPRGTGKTSIAKIFAKTLNCTNNQDAPCGVCENCKMAANGSHPDIIEIDAASNNGVDEVRNLIDKVKYAPMQGKYKIYIIDEVHMMTSGAFNALLKTIEEPPAHVIFIFATTEPNKVLPTIISRCQRFDFNKVSMHDIKYRLSVVCKNEGIEIDENGLTLIAQLADGGMRDALSILDQCVAYCSSHIDVNDIRKIYGVVTSEDIGKLFYSVYKKDVDSFVKDIQKYSDMGMDIKRLTADFIHMLKDSLILDYSENSTLVSDMNKDMIRKYFKLAPINFRIKCMEELMDTYNKYTYASNALDYLEASLLKISSYSYESKTHIIDSDHNDFKEVEEEENYETSYDDTSDDSDIIEKNTQKDDNNGVLEKSEISDVSRETRISFTSFSVIRSSFPVKRSTTSGTISRIFVTVSWFLIFTSLVAPFCITRTALGDIFPVIAPPALFFFSPANAPAPTPNETSTSGRMIVSFTVTASPTTVLADTNESIPLKSDATVASKLFLFSAIISSFILTIIQL